ncbi:MAG: EipB family protein, partial [Ferrovibrio sp.]
MSAVARLRVFILLLALATLPVGTAPVVVARAADASQLDEIARGLVSHKALYGLSIAKLDARNYRNGIAGGLSLEFLNACDGYVLNQRFLIETNTEDGTLINDMVLNSWESLDGQRFRFKMKDEVNGDLEQELAGEGTLKGRGESGLVRFTQPEDTDLALPAGTAFPTEHTMRLIQMARTGGNWLHAAVFDGASAEGYSEVGGFIGGELPVEKGDTPLLAPLKGQRSWRVRLAYFTSDKTQDTPDYEIAYRLFENGVVDDIVFDYGDYA